MEIIANYGTTLVLLAAVVGFLMAWGIGANDVANAMGTSVGTRSLTIKQAIIIAMIFEFAGAYLAGGEVTSTIRKGIIDSNAFVGHSDLLVLGMIASLLAAGVWLIVASHYGWPVSTTHSIIGAIIGFATVAVGSEAVQWGKTLGIVGSWVITPAISGFIAYFIFVSVQKLIFDTENPLKNAKRFVPLYMFLTAFVISLVTLKKGLSHIGLKLSGTEHWLYSVAASLVVMALGYLFIGRKNYNPSDDKDMGFANVEKVFAILMVLTACAMAFAHGSNDVANAIGPLSAVVSVVEAGGAVAAQSKIAWWILPLGAFGIVFGLAIMGKKVMATVGTGITHLTPSRGFAAQFATATTVVLASGTGLPISTTQTLVGAIMGVGLARGIAALNMSVIRNIVVSWVVTLPAGAFLSIIIFWILEALILG
ncbi:inorganic phosphate transporter [Gallaecimonas xiamenensis]|uniref:Phosphate transporter n=1 Tax=Gallaecimonas xiamenensis 3-C-1 TaxID=745411 RepID=K2IJE5_9GAMM|nr:inorganic phosphate transporter [Gallaecimonas xiamenensis]EKE70246.1 putative low-affinity inorganic phosphate transporter [Gallaecimonas xiamenensis 3-C-1]